MTWHLRCALLAGLFLGATACATTRRGGGVPTEVIVVDHDGRGLPGEIQLWSKEADESCETDDSSCTINLPAGTYNVSFRKARATRMSSGIGGSTGGDRYKGCLKARIQLVPGRTVRCKQTQDFNCNRGAYDTMECGESTASRYGYKAKAADDDEGEPAQRQAPAGGAPAAGPQREAPPAPPK